MRNHPSWLPSFPFAQPDVFLPLFLKLSQLYTVGCNQPELAVNVCCQFGPLAARLTSSREIKLEKIMEKVRVEQNNVEDFKIKL